MLRRRGRLPSESRGSIPCRWDTALGTGAFLGEAGGGARRGDGAPGSPQCTSRPQLPRTAQASQVSCWGVNRWEGTEGTLQGGGHASSLGPRALSSALGWLPPALTAFGPPCSAQVECTETANDTLRSQGHFPACRFAAPDLIRLGLCCVN